MAKKNCDNCGEPLQATIIIYGDAHPGTFDVQLRHLRQAAAALQRLLEQHPTIAMSATIAGDKEQWCPLCDLVCMKHDARRTEEPRRISQKGWPTLMAKQRPPAFQFYAKEFLAGTTNMRMAAVGAYIRILSPCVGRESDLLHPCQMTTPYSNCLAQIFQEEWNELVKDQVLAKWEPLVRLMARSDWSISDSWLTSRNWLNTTKRCPTVERRALKPGGTKTAARDLTPRRHDACAIVLPCSKQCLRHA